MAWCLSSENRRNNVYLDKLQNDKRHKMNQPTPTPEQDRRTLGPTAGGNQHRAGDIVRHFDDDTGADIVDRLTDIHAAQAARANDEVVFDIDSHPSGRVQQIRATRVVGTPPSPPLLLT